MTNSKKLQPGESFHFLESGLTFSISESWHSAGEVSRRGQTVNLTREMLTANSDTEGNSFFDLVDDPEGQVKRWGRVMYGRGEFPANLSVFVPGTNEHELERERRRQAAWALSDEVERGKALRAVLADFGASASTQVSVEYRGSTALPQREQA
jgi:hypothetical protein